MGVPVAKARGMKTGAAGHSDLEATSTGNETRFSSTRHFGAAHPLARDRRCQHSRRVYRGRCGKIANEPADVLVLRMNLTAPFDAADQLRRRHPR